jgi:glycosyltransferase involved in cell wall biosynthesis
MQDTAGRSQLTAAQRGSVRVVHLTLSHRPFDVRVFEKECRTLADAGYRVALAVPGAAEGSVEDGVALHDIPFAGGGPAAWRWQARLAAARDVASRLDGHIYHLHDPELIPVGLALQRRGARIVYDAHEDAPMEAWSLNRNRPFRRLVLPALWWSLLGVAKRRYDLFVAATPEIARRFPQQRTVLVRNYPRLDMFAVPDAGAGGTVPSRTLVFPGLVSETRGAMEMLAALSEVTRHGDIRLKLYGEISPAELEARMRAHAAWARVDYVGFRPWREVLDAYARSLAGLLLYAPTPEQRHAMPVKLFEFLLSGIPVIATDMPWWRQLVDGNPAVIFVGIGKPAEVARAIEQLADDPAAARGLGVAGAAHARARFDWAKEGAQLVAAYDRLVAAG